MNTEKWATNEVGIRRKEEKFRIKIHPTRISDPSLKEYTPRTLFTEKKLKKSNRTYHSFHLRDSYSVSNPPTSSSRKKLVDLGMHLQSKEDLENEHLKGVTIHVLLRWMCIQLASHVHKAENNFVPRIYPPSRALKPTFAIPISTTLCVHLDQPTWAN